MLRAAVEDGGRRHRAIKTSSTPPIGTLTVTDGVHTARLAMLGNHAAADFTLANDGSGHTLVFDPPVDSSGHLAPAH